MRRWLPRTLVAAVALGLLLLQVTSVEGATPSPTPKAKRTPENVRLAPGRRMNMTDNLSTAVVTASRQVRPALSATAAALVDVPPFLTRPYWDPHSVTSIFDHCNPDYSHDGAICEVDGTVAFSSNGVDPTFTAGYAISPGGTNYLYYDGHNGWDLGLSYETLIAAAPGVVQIAGTDSLNPGFGLTVTIDHQNGFTTRYAHMSQIWVSPGQAVGRGQPIGVSGNTGASTGPHLHFGLYVTNPWTAIDPWGWAGSSADPWPSDAGNKWITGNPQNPVPWAPTNVTAVAGDGAATVSWTVPAFTGGDPIVSYTVQANPGGASVTVPGSTTSAVVSGLTDYTSYTFTVTASGSVASGPASAASNAVMPVPSFPGRYHPLVPARLLDTRSSGGPIAPGAWRNIAIPGAAGVPATGVSAAALNVTALDASGDGYLAVHAAGIDANDVSNATFGAGRQVATLTLATVGSGGLVSIYNGSSTSPVDVVVDLQGWYSNAASPGPDGHYVAVTPTRIFDSRNGTGGYRGLVGPGQEVRINPAQPGAAPPAGAEAVVVNVTATDANAASYLAAYPAGQNPGQVSTVNFGFGYGTTVANRAIVGLGAGGQFAVRNAQGSVDVIVDIQGWITDTTGTAAAGLYTAMTPARVLDTRTGPAPAPLGAGQWLTVPLAGRAGIPTMTSATPPKAVVLVLSETNATAPSFLAVDPTGSTVRASDLNFQPGIVVSNLVVATLGADGNVHVFNSQGSADVMADVVGWYS